MPLAVIDNKGAPVGIIVGRYDKFFIVAGNKERYYLEELCPLDKLQQIAATHLNAKDFLGRVQQGILEEKLQEWWEKEQGLVPADFEPHLALRVLALVKHAHSTFQLCQKVNADYYFLCQSKTLDKGSIKMEAAGEELPFFAGDLPFPALVGRVVGYPEVEMVVQGIGEALFLGGGLNDLGGYNHTHVTRLLLRSGDVETTFDLPGIIHTRKGELIALEIKKDKDIDFSAGRIFTAGVVYKYHG
ncbi:MAG: hypothetical protein ACOX3A_04445 [bacterium]|jgi:hypothetical protein